MPLDGVAFSQLVDQNEVAFSIELQSGAAYFRDLGAKKILVSREVWEDWRLKSYCRWDRENFIFQK